MAAAGLVCIPDGEAEDAYSMLQVLPPTAKSTLTFCEMYKVLLVLGYRHYSASYCRRVATLGKEMTFCDALLFPTKRCVDTKLIFVGPTTCVCTLLARKRNAVQLKRYSTFLQTTKGSANTRAALRPTAAPTTADCLQAPFAPPPLCRSPRSDFSLLSRWRGISTSSQRR